MLILSTKNDTLTEEQVSEQNKLDITKPKTTPILTSTAFSGYLLLVFTILFILNAYI